jgi:hypothetical protein
VLAGAVFGGDCACVGFCAPVVALPAADGVDRTGEALSVEFAIGEIVTGEIVIVFRSLLKLAISGWFAATSNSAAPLFSE